MRVKSLNLHCQISSYLQITFLRKTPEQILCSAERNTDVLGKKFVLLEENHRNINIGQCYEN